MKKIFLLFLALCLLGSLGFAWFRDRQPSEAVGEQAAAPKVLSAAQEQGPEAVYAAQVVDGASAWMADCLTGGGDSVYFAGSDTEGWKLYRAARDGSDPSVLCAWTEESIESLCFADGRLYALSSRIEEYEDGTDTAFFALLELDAEGRELCRTELCGEGWPENFWPQFLQGSGGALYIAGSGSLCAVRPEDASRPLFCVPVEGGAELALLPDGQPVLGTPGTEGGFILQSVGPDGTLGERRELEESITRLYSGGERYSLYLADGSALYGYDWGSGALTRLLTWSQMGIIGGAVLETGAEDFLCLGRTRSTDPGCLMQLQKMDLDPSATGPLVLATLNIQDASIYLEESIGAWNRAHPDCPVELRDYGGGGDSRLLTDIASGNAPDLFDFSAYFYVRNTNLFSVGLLARRGLLEDLNPWLEKEPELTESLDSSLLSAFEMDGKLYEAVMGVAPYTCCGSASELGQDPANWTWEALEEKLAHNGRASSLLVDATFSEDLLSMLVSLSGDRLVDWSGGSCAFDSDYFLHLLQAVKDRSRVCDGLGANDANHTAWDPAGNDALLVLYSDDSLSMTRPLFAFGEELCLTGLPEIGPVAEVYLGVGVCSLSERKELCWEFVKSLYAVGGHCGAPLLREKRQAILGDRLEEYDEYPIEGVERERYAAFLEKNLAQLDQIHAVRRYDAQIDQIVRSEAGAYLNGQRSAEETAQAIQSRVSIYIAEQQ